MEENIHECSQICKIRENFLPRMILNIRYIILELCPITLKFNFNFRNIAYLPLTRACMQCALNIHVLKEGFPLATDTAA